MCVGVFWDLNTLRQYTCTASKHQPQQQQQCVCVCVCVSKNLTTESKRFSHIQKDRRSGTRCECPIRSLERVTLQQNAEPRVTLFGTHFLNPTSQTAHPTSRNFQLMILWIRQDTHHENCLCMHRTGCMRVFHASPCGYTCPTLAMFPQVHQAALFPVNLVAKRDAGSCTIVAARTIGVRMVSIHCGTIARLPCCERLHPEVSGSVSFPSYSKLVFCFSLSSHRGASSTRAHPSDSSIALGKKGWAVRDPKRTLSKRPHTLSSLHRSESGAKGEDARRSSTRSPVHACCRDG